jgi:hypothetical protein
MLGKKKTGVIIVFVAIIWIVFNYVSDDANLNEKSSIESVNNKSLPNYRILFRVDLISGKGVFGEVLISDYSKKTSKDEIENSLRAIIKKEGFVSAMLYSTEDAYRANMSESFSKAHPEAMEVGYLGQITEKGMFVY